MAYKPILFSGPMVRAILEGRKTQTRRVVKPQPDDDGRVDVTDKHAYIGNGDSHHLNRISLPYRVGDRFWVRETWALNSNLPADEDRELHRAIWPPDKAGSLVGPFIWYKADGEKGSFAGKWRPSIFMPRWASRITLEVTGVKCERLQEISIIDIQEEGLCASLMQDPCDMADQLKDKFKDLWDSIYADKYPWESSPWVWVISFRRREHG